MSAEVRRGKDRRADELDSVIDLLGKVRRRLADVDQRLDDMAGGFPSGHAGGGEILDGVAYEYASSTEANALNPGRDVAGPDRRRREQLLRLLAVYASELDDIDRKYLGANGSKPPDVPGCEVVGRFKGKDGRRQYWEAVHRHTDGRAFLVNPDGEFNHGEQVAVGQWAYDFGRRVGRWPNRTEVEKHMRGEDVRADPVDGARPRGSSSVRGWRREAVA